MRKLTNSALIASWVFAESNIHQKKYNQKKSKCYNDIEINLCEISHNYDSSSNQKAISKHTVAEAILNVKTVKITKKDNRDKFGKAKAAPIKAADIFVKRPDNTFSLGFVNNLFLENLIINYSNTRNILSKLHL